MIEPACNLPHSTIERLRNVRVSLREDLEVSRHLFRGEPAYVVRDPMTFQSQRLDAGDYTLLAHVSGDRSLGEAFEKLVTEEMLRPQDEDRFYQFILTLHGLGFLRLPVSDDRLLYQRYRSREKAKRRGRLTGLLFVRIPLINPNAFLDRTVKLMRPLFSRTAFAAWLILVLCAAYVAAGNWTALTNPLHGMLASGNLPMMWLTLITLKVFHEFGHAYACKHFGGHVPEMGAYLILFTPCAYMDATASWGFTRRRERIIVCLAGMYVEMAIAAAAVFVWAATGPSLVNSIAHNVIFLAGVVTILFNINPLMRYDGYYVLSDLLEIPNLRQRSAHEMALAMKHWLLGLRREGEATTGRLRVSLLSFGVAATLYRITLLVAIAAALASKMFVIGMLVGCALLFSTVGSSIWRLTHYLWYSEETQGRRFRAVALSMVLLLLLPSLIMWIPAPTSVRAAGWVTREQETVIRAKTPGFLEEVIVEPGMAIEADQTIVELRSDVVAERIVDADARLRASYMRRDAYLEKSPGKALEEEDGARAVEANLVDATSRLADLVVRAPRGGMLVECIRETEIGRFVNEGVPVAKVIEGPWEVRTWLTPEQWATSIPKVGDRASFRPASRTSSDLKGVVVRVAPGGSRTIETQAVTQTGGGDIAVDPVSGQTAEAYYEITIRLLPDKSAQWVEGTEPHRAQEESNLDDSILRNGLTGTVRLDAAREPIGTSIARRVVRFWNKLSEG